MSKEKVPGVFYPENKLRLRWERFNALIVVIACLFTPVHLAFQSENELADTAMAGIENTLDFFFFVDICLCFRFAYLDASFEVVDSKKKIATKYLSTWFVTDFFAFLPVHLIERIIVRTGGNRFTNGL